MSNAYPADKQDTEADRILVWDIPTRLIHWLIVVSFALSWWSAEMREMEWHYRSGMAMLFLVLFRLLWGIFGSRPSRFASFVRGPFAVLAYARTLFRRDHHPLPSHNPLGGWSAMALLTFLLAQVILGLFSVDTDGIESGPLSWLVDFESGRAAAEFHEWGFDLLLILTGLHIAAVLFYVFYKRENLILAMISGRKRMRAPPPSAVRQASAWTALVALLIAGAVTWAIWAGLPFLA